MRSMEAPIEMKIFLKDDTLISRLPYRLAPKETQEVNAQIDTWLESGVIRPSTSEFASNVVVARKKGGKPWVCINYKPLNTVVIRKRQPLPLIEDVIDRLVGIEVFAMLDLKDGFFHVPVEESSRKHTSFVTPSGQWEFCKVPFGLCNSQPVFQRYIQFILKDPIREKILMIYIDDLIILAENLSEALENLKKVLEVAAPYELQFNWKKCQILKRKIEFLGYTVEAGKI